MRILYLSDSIFSEIGCITFYAGICFPYNLVAIETEKGYFSVIIATVATKDKNLLQKLESYRFKPPLQKLG